MADNMTANQRTAVFRELGDLVEYAADVRWQELAAGDSFTVVDRQMLGELHKKAMRCADLATQFSGKG